MPHPLERPKPKFIKVLMLENQIGTIDGVVAQPFVAGKVYTLPAGPHPLPDCGDVFVKEGWAEEIFETADQSPVPKAEHLPESEAEQQPIADVEQAPTPKAEIKPMPMSPRLPGRK